MSYVVRALGWATKILWVLIAAFSVTSVYSAMNVRVGFGASQVFLSRGLVVLSIPLLVNNTGLYDLSELNITADVMDFNESLLSTSTTFVPLIPRGGSVEIIHNMSIGPDDIASKAPTYLFNDTIFDVQISARLNFAHTIPLQISTNMTMPWGAPLYNFSIGQISYDYLNLTHQRLIIPTSFENHSPYFGVDGFMQVEIYNDNDELLGFGMSDLNVQSHSAYNDPVEIIVDFSMITRSGEVHFYFETSTFSTGPVVMPYG